MLIVGYLMLGAFGAALGICVCDAFEAPPSSALEARRRELNRHYETAKAALLAVATGLLLAPLILW